MASIAIIAMGTLVYTVALILLLPAASHCLTGYDCGGQGLNITSLSLLDIGKCTVDNIEPKKESVYVQLLQLSMYDHTSVMQCKVEIDRTIYYCGMHSHVSIVRGGRRQYTIELTESICKKLQNTGTIDIGTGRQSILQSFKRNSTNVRSVTLAGTTTMDGSCTGTQYGDAYGTWEDVVVQAIVKVTLRNFEAVIDRNANKLILPSGVHCKALTGECLDSDGSETYWTVTPRDSCHFDQYDVLYEGPADKLTAQTNADTPIVYTVTTKETTFALTKTTETTLCGYKLMSTEHPKLFVLETKRGSTFKIRTRISVNNLDIFAYVNSKFIYVEKHIKTQLTQLYRDIMEQKCALEREILQNALSLASFAPDEMARRIMKAPGYTAVMAGEALHLVKCLAVECRVRSSDICYNEIPVTYKNQSLFMLPRTRILTKKGTPRDCNEFLPVMYNIHGSWYRLMPRPQEATAPSVIQPLTKPTWKYVSPSSLATSGIYTSADLDRLRDHIMFPMEKPSMLNTIARGAMGQEIPAGSVSMLNLLDEKSLDQIAENAGQRLWKGFITFGSASAGIIGIFIIIRLIKLIVDTIIHGYALHSIYGWSLHLLGAIWTSVTNLLLHLGNANQRGSTDRQHHSTPFPATENHHPKTPPLIEENKLTLTVSPTSEVRDYKELRKLLDNDAQNA